MAVVLYYFDKYIWIEQKLNECWKQFQSFDRETRVKTKQKVNRIETDIPTIVINNMKWKYERIGISK